MFYRSYLFLLCNLMSFSCAMDTVMDTPRRDGKVKADANRIFLIYNAAQVGQVSESLIESGSSFGTSGSSDQNLLPETSTRSSSSSRSPLSFESIFGEGATRASYDTSSLSSDDTRRSGEAASSLSVSGLYHIERFSQLILILRGYNEVEMPHLFLKLMAQEFDKQAKDILLADIELKKGLDNIRKKYCSGDTQKGWERLKNLATDLQTVEKIKSVLSLDQEMILFQDVNFLGSAHKLFRFYADPNKKTLARYKELITLLKLAGERPALEIIQEFLAAANDFPTASKEALTADLYFSQVLDEPFGLYQEVYDQNPDKCLSVLRDKVNDPLLVQKAELYLKAFIDANHPIYRDIALLKKTFSFMQKCRDFYAQEDVVDENAQVDSAVAKFCGLCVELSKFEDERRLISCLIQKADPSSDRQLGEDLNIIKRINDLLEQYDRYSFTQLIGVLSSSNKLEKVCQAYQKGVWVNPLLENHLLVLYKVYTDSNSGDQSIIKAFFDGINRTTTEEGSSELMLSCQLRAFLNYAPKALKEQLCNNLIQAIVELYGQSDDTPSIRFLSLVLDLFVDDPFKTEQNTFINTVNTQSFHQIVKPSPSDSTRRKRETLLKDITIWLESAKVVKAYQYWNSDPEKYSWERCFSLLTQAVGKNEDQEYLARLSDSFLIQLHTLSSVLRKLLSDDLISYIYQDSAINNNLAAFFGQEATGDYMTDASELLTVYQADYQADACNSVPFVHLKSIHDAYHPLTVKVLSALIGMHLDGVREKSKRALLIGDIFKYYGVSGENLQNRPLENEDEFSDLVEQEGGEQDFTVIDQVGNDEGSNTLPYSIALETRLQNLLNVYFNNASSAVDTASQEILMLLRPELFEGTGKTPLDRSRVFCANNNSVSYLESEVEKTLALLTPGLIHEGQDLLAISHLKTVFTTKEILALLRPDIVEKSASMIHVWRMVLGSGPDRLDPANDIHKKIIDQLRKTELDYNEPGVTKKISLLESLHKQGALTNIPVPAQKKSSWFAWGSSSKKTTPPKSTTTPSPEPGSLLPPINLPNSSPSLPLTPNGRGSLTRQRSSGSLGHGKGKSFDGRPRTQSDRIRNGHQRRNSSGLPSTRRSVSSIPSSPSTFSTYTNTYTNRSS